MYQFTKLLSDITNSDLEEAGQKAIRLGMLYSQQLNSAFKIPSGFVLNASAYKYLLAYNNLDEQLQELLKTINPEFENIADIAAKCRKLILSAKIPRDLEAELSKMYNLLFTDDEGVSVRSSITEANFPDELTDTYLNIRGPIALSYAVKCCFASLFSEKALHHRFQQKNESFIAVALLVQKMVRSDLGISGTVYTEGNNLYIKSLLGLSDILNSNEAEPDIFILNKDEGQYIIQQKIKGKKGRMSVYSENAAGTNSTIIKITPAEIRDNFSLTDEEIHNITSYIVRNNNYCFEWAKDGITNNFYLTNLKNQ